MSPEPRDWDKELAEIDKVIARSPQPGAGTPPARISATGQPPALPPRAGRKAVLGTWLQVLLGVLLAVGMTQWPYTHGCGWRLFLYLGAAAAVVLAGIWGAVGSWRRRLPLPHVLSLVVMLWGLVLVAREVLPRAGYARQALEWNCP